LGPSIVYSIPNKHGGLIRLELNPVEENLFHFYLPASESFKIPHPLLSKTGQIKKSKLSGLILDDDEASTNHRKIALPSRIAGDGSFHR
jgi:hypothetical protein